MNTDKEKTCLAELCKIEIFKVCTSRADFQQPTGRESRFITGARAVFDNNGTPIPFVEQDGLEGVYQMGDGSIAALYRDRIDTAADPEHVWMLADNRFVGIINDQNPHALDDALNAAVESQLRQQAASMPQDEYKPPANVDEAQALLKDLEQEDLPAAMRYSAEFGVPLETARAEIRQSAERILSAHRAVWSGVKKKLRSQPDVDPEEGPAPLGH